jgi:hypothetical protein
MPIGSDIQVIPGTQKNGAVSKVNNKFISHPRDTTYTISTENSLCFFWAISSSLLVPTSGRGTTFQDGVAVG